ncbi:hypothetical protein LEP1GSC124_2792 [Leptospira interrogans serovar Pyrogenes str. 200701872]|uniref:Uncharacterized protein n=1 Tax=Leptospira interrogans serovar Pyrogenes str. 200701872 TaxID=1193029 RepID=M6ZRH6_LEPIR|nr:hypothetical protein LEP1GSC124_2792 [Leptospira interrogans serovar Pyrogenes str. 200701872]
MLINTFVIWPSPLAVTVTIPAPASPTTRIEAIRFLLLPFFHGRSPCWIEFLKNFLSYQT